LQSANAFDGEKPFASSFEFGFRAWIAAAKAAGSAQVKHAKAG
jgi:hypothetical protein